jgi:hypothetical protein
MTPFAPPTSPRIWSDGRDIYLEFDAKGDHASVLRFPLSEAGLSKALKHIPNIALTPGYVSGNKNIYDKIIAPKIMIARKTAAVRARPKLSVSAKDTLKNLVKGVKY